MKSQKKKSIWNNNRYSIKTITSLYEKNPGMDCKQEYICFWIWTITENITKKPVGIHVFLKSRISLQRFNLSSEIQ